MSCYATQSWVSKQSQLMQSCEQLKQCFLHLRATYWDNNGCFLINTNSFILVSQENKLYCLEVKRYRPCLNSGSASFGGCIWRPITSQRRTKAVPIRSLVQMQPSNAASFSIFVDEAHVATHMPRFFAHPKKKKEREKMWHREASIVTFTGLGSRDRVVRVKYLVTQLENAPKARQSHLTTVSTVNKVSPKDLHSKTTKAGSSEGCGPWIVTCHIISFQGSFFLRCQQEFISYWIVTHLHWVDR